MSFIIIWLVFPHPVFPQNTLEIFIGIILNFQLWKEVISSQNCFFQFKYNINLQFFFSSVNICILKIQILYTYKFSSYAFHIFIFYMLLLQMGHNFYFYNWSLLYRKTVMFVCFPFKSPHYSFDSNQFSKKGEKVSSANNGHFTPSF